ncbi:MAG: lysophospholipase [Pseudobdellovibrionaceae bacterium]
MVHTAQEFKVKAKDSAELFVQYHDLPKAKGLVLVTHGHGEHSSSYHRLYPILQDSGYAALGWDLRGHGKSQGKRGYIQSFDLFLDDLGTMVEFAQNEYSNLKLHLLGHSMGGLIATSYLLKHQPEGINSLILSSPFFGVSLQVPLFKDLGAILLGKVLPQITLFNEISDEQLSQDPEVLKEYPLDHFRHNKISPEVYMGSLRYQQYVERNIQKLQTRTFIQVPESDPVVSTETTRKLVSKISPALVTLIEYRERRHEIYNDIGRQKVFSDLKNFLLRL